MAKLDHIANLPKIFRENDLSLRLSILPVTRSQYVIGPFQTHQTVAYASDIETISMRLPSNLESIDYSNLYSEAAALNCAFNAGIIDDLVGENTYHTVSGRMSTESFTYLIGSTVDHTSHRISVDSSQCEIDAGFESSSHFVLIEAKNQTVSDFLIRQLYYPYRLWSARLSKRVLPVLMTFSDDIFDFFVYEFADPDLYNSLRLVRRKRYSIAPENITHQDVDYLLARAQPGAEPVGVPFPQADSFNRVIDVMQLLADSSLTRDDITENYDFDARQTNYYTDAARYLGLVEKFIDPVTKDVTFRLTNDARALVKMRPKLRHMGLVRKILERQVFYHAFVSVMQQGIPDTDTIDAIMVNCGIQLNETTRTRRARTVRGWISWIVNQIEM